MKSLLRGKRLVTIMLFLFLVGMFLLIYRIQTQASFYISNSESKCFGMVYDRNGDVLFDGMNGFGAYEAGHFADIGNLIGDTSGQMSNTLVARNGILLNNYSFHTGVLAQTGKASITTTLDHVANRAVFDALGAKDGAVIAYNYKTGELLTCVSKPCVDVASGYENLAEGSLICKAFYSMVPGSTQKVSTLVTAVELLGTDRLNTISYNCSGTYLNHNRQNIKCHKASGHGTQDIATAFANSCNPFFAQLVEHDLPLSGIVDCYTKMGYAVNGAKKGVITIDGIRSETASTNLTDTNDFDTQWSCIGQGDSLVSPCQLMMWQSAIANATGKATQPHLIANVTDVKGKQTQSASTAWSDELFSTTAAQTVRDIELQNGANRYASKIPGYTLGVKSGTAQVKNGAEENSLLVGFTADDSLPVAFAIVIENRTSADVSTDHIAKVLLDTLNRT